MTEIEMHQLERPYQHLRITTRAKQGRLMASLESEGQQTPILVVAGGGADRYVLIDGYVRATALEALGHDGVCAVVLPLDEADALVLWYRQEWSGRRTPLEESWLLQALVEGHGLSQAEAGRRLRRTTSWVSRRLALITALPTAVQTWVREGKLSAQGAMKYLVPLARANAEHCVTLAEKLAGQRVTVRQMKRLYLAWHASDAQGRARLVDRPLWFLQADDEISQPEPPDPDDALIKDVRILGAISSRATQRLMDRSHALALPTGVLQCWPVTAQSFSGLASALEERRHAR